MSKITFNPENDIPDQSGRVFLVTGGTMPLNSTNPILFTDLAIQALPDLVQLPSPSSLLKIQPTSTSVDETKPEPPNSSPKFSKQRHPPNSPSSNVTSRASHL
jgi:hypothetical protein